MFTPPQNPNFRTNKWTKKSCIAPERSARDVIDEESRTIELSFSSDAAVERVFGNEVLEHDKGVR